MERFKAKIQKLFSTGFFDIFGSTVINKVLVFLSTIVIVRIVSKTEYGIFTYAWNIYHLAILLSGFGIASGALQVLSESYRENDRFDKVYGFSVKFGVLFNVLLLGIILLIGLFIPLPVAGSNGLLCMLALLPEFYLLQGLQSTYLRTKRLNRQYAAFSIINTVLVALMTILGAFLLSATGLVVGRYSAFILSVLIGVIVFKIPFCPDGNGQLTKTDKNDILKISGISMLNSGLSQILYLIDVFIVGLVMTQAEDVAAYKVATQIPTALSFIPSAIVTYIYPYFAEHNDNGKWCLHRYKQVLLYMGGANLIISGLLYLTAPYIISIVFGRQYFDAVITFRLLCISYFFSGTFRTIAGNLLVTQRKLNYNTFVAVFSGVVNLIADYLMVKAWGINGAAIATLLIVLLTSVLNVVYLIYVFKKKAVS